jgi:hypothetical protein
LQVERSVAEYSIHEPIDAAHASEAVAAALSDGAVSPQHTLASADIEDICANPLCDEPHPVVVGAVKRFGLVGLVACALGTGLVRWCRSLTHRIH